MGIITENEWEKINKIILMIYSEDDSKKMRKKFLEELRRLVVYDIGEFSLGNDDYRFYDSVEVNMDTGKMIDILAKYYEYKDNHTDVNIDWVFRWPDSIVVRERDVIRGDAFEATKINKLFLARLNMKYFCTISLALEGKFVGELTVYRSDAYEGFSDRDLYVFEQFKDHLANRLFRYKHKNQPGRLTKEQYAVLGKSNLSEREIEIFELAYLGISNDNISKQLFISENTVKKHLGNIYGKLEIKNRIQLKSLF